MSALSLRVKLVLSASALAGLTLLACGSDPAAPPSKNNNKDDDSESTSKKDAGSTKKDAGSTTKKDAGATIPEAESGDECTGKTRAHCTDCDKEPCYTTCEDDVYGECKSLIAAIDSIKDAGGKIVTDAGEFSASDGQVSVKFGDASVVIPPMACPAPLVCSSTTMAISASLISGLAGGAAACIANDAVGFPPSCSTATECTAAGLKLSQCVMGYCIQICK
ncbi:MAG: hypothetical protein RLZZ450_6883 [Pseudomonadota bacterium]